MNMEKKFLEIGFEIKKLEQNGSFEGYGSVFGVEDFGGDIVAKGAFSKSLAHTSKKGKKLPILWQHNPSEPLGVYEELKEDEYGLFVKGQLLIDDVIRAKEAYALMKAGAITGLSIGSIANNPYGSVVDSTDDARIMTRHRSQVFEGTRYGMYFAKRVLTLEEKERAMVNSWKTLAN